MMIVLFRSSVGMAHIGVQKMLKQNKFKNKAMSDCDVSKMEEWMAQPEPDFGMFVCGTCKKEFTIEEGSFLRRWVGGSPSITNNKYDEELFINDEGRDGFYCYDCIDEAAFGTNGEEMEEKP